MIGRRPELRQVLDKTWQLRQQLPDEADGPVRRIAEAVRDMNWRWTAPVEFQDHDGITQHCLQLPAKEWDHRVRDALRHSQWTAMVRHKNNRRFLGGIERGIDRQATLAWYRNSKVSASTKDYLRVLLTAGTQSFEVLNKVLRGRVPSHCPFCSSADAPVLETVEHINWECPHWTPIRKRHAIEALTLAQRAGRMPPCLAACGIVPDGFDTADQWLDASRPRCNISAPRRPQPRPGAAPPAAPAAAATVLGPALPADDDVRDARGEAHLDGYMIVFTDGACTDNQDSRFRRAGSGAFWGPSHPKNASFAIEGELQANNLAELSAILHVLRTETRPVQIRTDSQWCRDGHAVQWREIHRLLQQRPAGSVQVVWAKGHVRDSQVASGQVTLFNKLGNDAADALATAGAASHARTAAVRQCTDPKRVYFMWGDAILRATRWWLEQLRWPRPDVDRDVQKWGVTLAELAIDFKVSTGLDLPPPIAELAKHRKDSRRFVTPNWVEEGIAATGSDAVGDARRADRIARDLLKRSRCLMSMICRLGELLPTPPVPPRGRHEIAAALTALGLQARGNASRFSGFARRPIFAGGAATYETLRHMAAHSEEWAHDLNGWAPYSADVQRARAVSSRRWRLPPAPDAAAAPAAAARRDEPPAPRSWAAAAAPAPAAGTDAPPQAEPLRLPRSPPERHRAAAARAPP
eukprot:gene4645-602_t